MQPWHKLERENILSQVGLRIEYGKPVETGENKGTFKIIGAKDMLRSSPYTLTA